MFSIMGHKACFFPLKQKPTGFTLQEGNLHKHSQSTKTNHFFQLNKISTVIQILYLLHEKTFFIKPCKINMKKMIWCSTAFKATSFTPASILLDIICSFGGAGCTVVVANFTQWEFLISNIASFYMGKTELMATKIPLG